MSLSETYARVRSGIVAFVPTYPGKLRLSAIPHEFIFGTGFIVGDSLIATNGHVAEAFKQFPSESNIREYDVSVMLFVNHKAW